MTPHDDTKQAIVWQWIHKAQTDITLAEHLVAETESFWSPIAFHSQQAAEKYLKALLVWNDIGFPKTHDLGKLLKLMEEFNSELAAELHEAAFLTPYGVEVRYPADRPEASPEDARNALALARKVRDSVMDLIPSEADTENENE